LECDAGRIRPNAATAAVAARRAQVVYSKREPIVQSSRFYILVSGGMVASTLEIADFDVMPSEVCIASASIVNVGVAWVNACVSIVAAADVRPRGDAINNCARGRAGAHCCGHQAVVCDRHRMGA
jgi:hypothetical protein